jgi:four helix bundle protein
MNNKCKDKPDIKGRTYNFAVRIIELVKKLPNNTIGFKLGAQLFSSGTSIGANVEEATGAYSKEDFTYKMSIAFKEAKETHYWLRLIKDTSLLSNDLTWCLQEAKEIKNILGKTVKTSRQK